jgi:hypothetical protein
MVSKEELEDILHDEEVEARWNSIDQKKLRKAEKEHQWYLNYTKKEYHPMSYRIKQEVDEWERTDPLFKEFKKIERKLERQAFIHIFIWCSIGFAFIWSLLLQ